MYQILDPLVGLPLGIDEKGPPPRVLDNGTILHRQHVLGQSSYLPAAYLDWVPQGGEEGGRGGVGDVELGQLLLPNANQICAIFTLTEEERGREGGGCDK